MPVIALLGAQWGDEGKGHIADMLADQASIVARYNGGDNAGHSITIEGKVTRTHLIPAGAFHPNTLNILGSGMVINLRSLAREVDELNQQGANLTSERLKIDESAHLLLPSHVALDGVGEIKRGAGAIGTTKRGIGPAYTDKAARIGLRASLMKHPTSFAEAVAGNIQHTNLLLTKIYGESPLDTNAIVCEYKTLAERFVTHLANTTSLVHRALEQNETVLAEGAQGVLLDLDHGSYPFVTSSTTTTGGVLTSLGVGPKHISRVIGVAKAYCTRVGAGPFPTELRDEIGTRLRGTGANPWDEFGTTTGRPRRTGWLDLVALKYAARINGLTEMVLTKLDILTGIEQLKVCMAYEYNGQRTTEFPSDVAILNECVPLYEELSGWQENISHMHRLQDLPPAARTYIEMIESHTGTSVSHISVGPDRSQVFKTHY